MSFRYFQGSSPHRGWCEPRHPLGLIGFFMVAKCLGTRCRCHVRDQYGEGGVNSYEVIGDTPTPLTNSHKVRFLGGTP